MSGSVYYEGNAFIDGGQVQNVIVTSSSVSNSAITTSSLDMNLANITSVKDPINAQDAATKKYVDDLGIVFVTVTLSGTTPISISSKQKGSYVITVSNVILNGPSGIFHVTKNDPSREGHVVRTVSSPGYQTNNSLRVSWPSNNNILLWKTESTFTGSYIVKIM